MDSIQQDPPLKQCCQCLQYKPATLEFFGRRKASRDGLYPSCKVCISKRYKDTYIRKTPLPEVFPDGYQRCKECKKLLPLEFFNQDKGKKYGVRNQCRECRNKIRRKTPLPIPCPDGYQRCTKCAQVFPSTPEYFYRDKIVKDGLKSWCKTCHIEHNKKYYSQPSIQARQKAKHQTKEFREKSALRRRAWRKQHPEAARIERKAIKQKRRSLILSSKGKLTAKDIRNQYKNQRGKCYYCHKRLGRDKHAYHVDHIVPLTRDGSNSPDNIVIACPPCNMHKHNKLPHEWFEGGRLL